MKKITLSLLAGFGLFGTAISQPVTSIQAPLYDGSNSSLSTPSGSVDAVYHRSCWLVLKSELTGLALTNSVITSWGIDFTQGVNVATAGQVTLSLENTADVTYTKGTGWPALLTGMSTNYTGAFNLPVTNGFTSVTVPLTTNFTYTGGGIYVALEWYAPTANSTQWARSQCNTTGPGLTTVGGARGIAPSAGPAPTTLSTTAFRPAFRFEAANTATNEVAVLSMQSLGQVTRFGQIGEVIQATLRNNSNVALSSVNVGLNISGANAFTDVQTVSIGSGSVITVNFTPFNATNGGTNSMSVAVMPDQDNTNNLATWTQSVGCNVVAVTPYLAAGNFTSFCYGGGTGGGIVAMKYTTGTAPTTISAVRCVVPSFTVTGFNGNAGSSAFAVLCDATGAIVSQGNPVTFNSTNMDVLTAFNFTTPIALTPSTTYYFGLGTSTGTNAPFGAFGGPTTLIGHYRIPLAGGTPVLTDLDYLSLSATLTFSNTTMSASASKTMVCKQDGPNSVTVTATGGGTNGYSYTWTPVPSNNMAVAVTPSVAGTGTGSITYNVIGTETVSGCRTNLASVSVAVSLCSALSSNTSNGYDLKVFPNPAVNGKSTISGLAGTNVITVFNTLGQVVLTQTVSTESTSIDLSAYPAGNYMVKITDENKESRALKIINQN